MREEIVPALGQGMGMRIDAADFRKILLAAQEVMPDSQDDLRGNPQRGVDEEVEGVADDPLGGIFNGNHARIAPPFFDLGKDVLDSGLRDEIGGESETLDGRPVGEGRLAADKRNLEWSLEGPRGGDDFAK